MDLQRLTSLLRQTIQRYQMISPGDSIAVGLSGGKDSLCLLAGLAALRRFYPVPFTLHAIHVDVGAGMKDEDIHRMSAFCAQLEVPFHHVRTDIYQIVFEERKEKNPCSLCAKMRRGALNELAKEVGCNKVALGHHRDDALETLLLCLLHEGRIHTFHPSSYLSRMDLTVIRPMVYVPEKHIIHLTKVLDLPIVKSPCPANGNTQREEMKNLLDSLCRLYPNARELMLSALRNEEQYGLWNKPKD